MQKNKVNLKRILSKFSLVFILIAFMIICSLISPHFLTARNLINVLRQQSVYILLALGEMTLIISGMIDLAAGSTLALAGCVSIMAYLAVPNMLVAFAVSILVAVACNLLSGIMVTKFKMPPFISTLAMQTMARGMVLYVTGGQNIYNIGDYTSVGQGNWGPIPIPVVIMLAALLVMLYIMKYTKFGRSTYAVGGNQMAATAAGINADAIKIKAYLLHGVLIGVAGVVFMSRVNGGLPNGGLTYESEAITATIVGGTSFSGGAGTPFGTFLGALIVGFLNNVMNLLSIDSYIQQIVRGVIIAVAVATDIMSRNRQTYKKKILKS